MAFNPSYLLKSRHGLYYFRYPLPKSFHPYGKREYVKVSLGTYYKKEALHYCDALRYIGRVICEQLHGMRMDYLEKKKLIQKHFKNGLDEVKARIHKEGLLSTQDLIVNKVRRDYLQRTELAKEPTLGQLPPEAFHELCAQVNIPLDSSHKDYKAFLSEYRKGAVKYYDDIAELNKDVSSPTYTHLGDGMEKRSDAVIEPVRSTAIDAVVVGESLTEVMSKYFDEHVDKSWARSTYKSYKAYRKFLLENLADPNIPLKLFSLNDVRHIRECLGNTNKASRTKNGYLTFYYSFFKWAKEFGYTDTVLFEGMRFKDEGDNVEKIAFSAEELSLIYNALINDRDELMKKPHFFWVTMLAMFTGARGNELAQLHVEDIQEHNGIWLIDITGAREDAQLKNKVSKRTIPIHDQLLELGFLDYVNSIDSGRIFPMLTYLQGTGYYKVVGDWFNNRFLSKRLGIKRPEITFHCFRHSLVSKLSQKNVEEPKIARIVGHASASMTQRYNSEGYTTQQLKDAIDLFPVPTE